MNGAGDPEQYSNCTTEFTEARQKYDYTTNNVTIKYIEIVYFTIKQNAKNIKLFKIFHRMQRILGCRFQIQDI